MDTESLLKLIIETAEDFKAEDITVLKLSEVSDFTDYFVIMSGNSSTHIQSLAEEFYYKTKHAGRPASDREGIQGGEWVLLDYGDIVVHIFHPEKRAYYNLEELWSQAEVIRG